MWKIMLIFSAIFILSFLVLSAFNKNSNKVTHTTWGFQSIDTMKQSRDLAREKLGSKSYKKDVKKQVKQIADTGATHIAIDTPYDEEFYPVLKLWVDEARANDLKIWFRGNWSGWEGWFEYSEIDREEHKVKTSEFIIKHPELFQDGDVFSACPECENGGPGDPRTTGDIIGHRNFLIQEYKITTEAFNKINKNVASNFNSMNGDVAKLIMDKDTTSAMGGVVVIDHYVKDPEQFATDIKQISQSSGGKIILGEFGAPIPDIHGEMNEEIQAKWLDATLKTLSLETKLIGVNYWTNTGSTTELWDAEGNPKKAVSILKKYFTEDFTN